MSIRVLSASGHRRVPWKNGVGETAEVFVHPPNADMAGFGWRVSMATVAGDGPFSEFPGIDRSIVLMSGNGIRLKIGRRRAVALTASRAPFSFPGDLPASARLIDGPSTVLNVMSRRGQFTHRLMCTAVDLLSRDAGPTWRLVVAPHDLMLKAGGERLALAAGDVLLCEGAHASLSLTLDEPRPVPVIDVDFA